MLLEPQQIHVVDDPRLRDLDFIRDLSTIRWMRGISLAPFAVPTSRLGHVVFAENKRWKTDKGCEDYKHDSKDPHAFCLKPWGTSCLVPAPHTQVLPEMDLIVVRLALNNMSFYESCQQQRLRCFRFMSRESTSCATATMAHVPCAV